MNVGVIRGGRSVNTIAPDASFELDMRSADVDALQQLYQRARTAIRGAIGSAGELRMRRIGNRPGGHLEVTAPIIRAVIDARKASGLGAPEFRASSTDANAAVAAGIPATCIGVTTGGEAHTPREWIRTAPIKQGVPYVGRAIAAVASLPRGETTGARRR
ncbi:MAG: peptidase dimerization domain-containing protein [Dehalococcoidia bacterium]|nr:peptidase dimerization domain-containing protein [Dehalococcoidia bacterium]